MITTQIIRGSFFTLNYTIRHWTWCKSNAVCENRHLDKKLQVSFTSKQSMSLMPLYIKDEPINSHDSKSHRQKHMTHRLDLQKKTRTEKLFKKRVKRLCSLKFYPSSSCIDPPLTYSTTPTLNLHQQRLTKCKTQCNAFLSNHFTYCKHYVRNCRKSNGWFH